MLKFVAAVAALLPTAAEAAPVYLECHLNTTDGLQSFDVQLNEGANSVTYSYERSGQTLSFTAKGFYGPERVAFSSFAVSRVDLSFERDNRDSAFFKYSKWNPVDKGQCAINKQQRAF